MDKLQQERAGAIALNRIFGLEPAIARAVTETLDNSAAIFKMSRSDVNSIFGPFSKYRQQITPQALEDAFRELSWLQERGFHFISIREDAFPRLLRDCPDSPVGLYIRSSSPPEELFNRGPALAVVGTRDPTPYGLDWCNRLVGTVATAKARPLIVSGLAMGIDICAHMSALGHGLDTIAVLPTSINDVYPRRHSVAAGKIASRRGSALVSDFPPGTSAQAFTFLRRNRIIAGLSDACLLVESKIKGGGTITTKFASGYGREVYALPGRIDDVRSAGCNRIIAEKIAEPVSDPEKFAKDLGLGPLSRRNRADFHTLLEQKYSAEDPSLVLIGDAIKSSRGISVEGLCRLLGLPFQAVSAACSRLECDNLIEMDLLQCCTVKNC